MGLKSFELFFSCFFSESPKYKGDTTEMQDETKGNETFKGRKSNNFVLNLLDKLFGPMVFCHKREESKHQINQTKLMATNHQ